MQPGLQLEDREVAGQAEEGRQEEAQTRIRRQRPRVSESGAPEAIHDIPALLKQIEVLEAQVKHLEAERFLSFGQFAAAVVPLQRAIVLGHTPSRALLAWLFLHAREGIAINRHAALELVEE